MKRAIESGQSKPSPTLLNTPTMQHRAGVGNLHDEVVNGHANIRLHVPEPESGHERLLAMAGAPALGNNEHTLVVAPRLAPWLEPKSEELTDHEDLLEAVLKRANDGDIDAYYELGCAYEEVPYIVDSGVQARKWFEMAVAQNHVDAAWRLGNLYLIDAVNRQKDPNFAAELFKKSADQGSVQGLLLLGEWCLDHCGLPVECFANGPGCKTDLEKAFKCFYQAATRDDKKGMSYLWKMFLEGFGVRRDLALATYWRCKCSQTGDSIEIEERSPYVERLSFPSYTFEPMLPYLAKEIEAIGLIKSLSLCDLDIDDQGAAHIAAMIKSNKTLTFLDIGYNDIGEAGAAAIVQAVLCNTTLTKICVIESPGFTKEMSGVLDKRVKQNAKNAQVAQLLSIYVPDQVNFSSALELPVEVAQLIMQELILNDQFTANPLTHAQPYPTIEETRVRAQELAYVIGNAEPAQPRRQ